MLLGAVRRSDQRAKGQWYVRGLLSDGARKSMQPMAARLGVDHQALQQFISSSTWDYQQVRRNVARWAVDVVVRAAYVVDDTGFGKDGTASPCVARQYSGTLGKTGNCQIGVSVQMVTDTASLAANWRLFCPASWDETTATDSTKAAAIRARRADAGIPEQVRHREKWRLALDMIDQMIGDWGLPRLPVVADSGYGDCTAFRLGLANRGLSYIVEVDGGTSAHPHDATPRMPTDGRRGRATYPDKPSNLRALAIAAGRQALRTITSRTATSPSPCSPKPSAPYCASTQKHLRRPDSLRRTPRTTSPARGHGRHMPPLQPPIQRHDLTKYYQRGCAPARRGMS